MEALLQQLEVKGFSEKSLGFQQHLGDPLQTESMTTDGFALLTEQGFDLLNPIATQKAYFLNLLFQNYGLAPQTVKGYRPSLVSVLDRTVKGSCDS